MEQQQLPEKYLRQLGTYLEQQQLTGEILIYEDILLFLVIHHLDVTQNIHAYIHVNGSEFIREAAQNVAEREHISQEWLYEAAQILISHASVDDCWLEYPGIRVYTTLPEYMLVMSIVAQDSEVVQRLITQLQLTDVQEVLDVVTLFLSEQALTQEIRLYIQNTFPVFSPSKQ